MNYRKILTVSSAAILTLGLFSGVSNTSYAAKSKTSDNTVKKSTKKAPSQTITSYNLMTKVGSNKKYTIWKTVTNGKPAGKVANAAIYRYAHLQSNQSIQTKKYTYWLVYVDGRRLGWVNERYFTRNKIAVPKTVSLVNNPNYTFNTRDAISYATDKTGTVVDNEDVSVSEDTIDSTNPGTTKVEYDFGSAKATTDVTVRKTASEGVTNANSVQAKEGTNSLKSWKTHYGASINYLSPHDFTTESDTNTWTSGNMTLSTRLYQPVLLSVKTDTNNEGNINRVGHIPEGLTVSNNWAYTSLLSHTNLIQGHIVGYNLSKLKSPYNAQYLLTMKLSKFNTYAQNIKVSPYIPIGHGQALGSTDKYVYALVNDNNYVDSNKSEELVQIRKSDMLINKIWTIKCWNGDQNSPRYFKNGVITSDHQMYCVNYDKKTDRYEYWEFNRTGDNWNPTLVGATKSTFVGNGEPVQGFTYDSANQNFYLAFNDLIVKIGRDGTLKDHYDFKTGREIEGISVSNNRLYVNLAQRAELLQSNPLN